MSTQRWAGCSTCRILKNFSFTSNAKHRAPEPTLLRGISDRLGPSAPKRRRTGSCRRGDSLSTLRHTHHIRSSSPEQPKGASVRPAEAADDRFEWRQLMATHRRGDSPSTSCHTRHTRSSSPAQPERPTASGQQKQQSTALHGTSSRLHTTHQQQQQPGTAVSDSTMRPVAPALP